MTEDEMAGHKLGGTKQSKFLLPHSGGPKSEIGVLAGHALEAEERVLSSFMQPSPLNLLSLRRTLVMGFGAYWQNPRGCQAWGRPGLPTRLPSADGSSGRSNLLRSHHASGSCPETGAGLGVTGFPSGR